MAVNNPYFILFVDAFAIASAQVCFASPYIYIYTALVPNMCACVFVWFILDPGLAVANLINK